MDDMQKSFAAGCGLSSIEEQPEMKVNFLNNIVGGRLRWLKVVSVLLILTSPFEVSTSSLNSSSMNIDADEIIAEEAFAMMMYCNSTSNNTSDEYISNVQLGTINNTSGASSGYSDFTSISTDLQGGQIYTITVTPTWTGTVYNEGYAAWIDLNHDGDFTDPDEQIMLLAPSQNTPVTGTFLLSSIATPGNTTMRVSMKYNDSPDPCETFTYGEVEDYTINILAADPVLCNTECTTPYYFDWYDGTTGAQWPITNGEASVTNIYTISGPQGDYNVSVTMDNPDTQNIDFANCAVPIERAYTATCNDPNGNADCDGNSGTNDSQFSYGCGYLTFGITSDNSSQYTSITYEFEYPAFICGLEIGDIDYSGSGQPLLTSYQDEVEVVADSAGFPVVINAVAGPAVDVYNNNSTYVQLLAEYTLPGSGDILPNDPAGHAYITTESRVTSITFTYSNGPADDGQSDDHAIRLAGFDFCPTSQVEICDNNIDDNANGYPDTFDPDCPGYSPFVCDTTIYQSTSPDNGITYYLDEVYTGPVGFNRVYDLSANGVNATGFNALAFNPEDRFIYGINPLKTGNYELYRVNNSGAVQYIGNLTGLSGTNDAGTMGPNETYFVTGVDQKLFVIDIYARNATEIADLGFYAADIAYNPVDDMIYAWNADASQLYSIDPANGNATAIGSPNTQYGEMGSMWINAHGSMIAYGDDTSITGTGQETLVSINTSTGVVTPIGTGPESPLNDGCGCSFGIGLTKVASSVAISPGDALSYTFTIHNRTDTIITNATFEDILPTGLTYSSNPYNITGITMGSPSIIGSSTANFVISAIPPGDNNSFTIDINVPTDFCDDIYNQARLYNVGTEYGSSIVSDDPNSPEINDPTLTILENCEEYWIEAECENVGANWLIQNDGNASRDYYATIAPGNNSLSTAPTGVDDRITFNVTITNPGNYNIFARVYAPTSNDDSFWVRANGGTWYRWNTLSSFASAGWEWGQVWNSDAGNALVSFPLVAGANTIDFAYREDGAQLDKINVTFSNTTPTGEGGISTNCPEICDNGIDDDGDGLTDCEDPNCSGETYCQGPCIPEKLFVERWFGISGNAITDLTSHPNYPNSPDELDYVTIFQGPNGYADNYGTRVRGFIIPSEDGTYTFNVTGDDNTVLYLSTDVNESNKSEIASVTGWTNVTQHDKYVVQTSADIELRAGVWYYVELLVKEGTGGDHFQVYWRTPSVPSTWTLIPGSNLAPFICPEICDNGDDDDNDGLTDCLDPDCENGVNVFITSADNVICFGETATLTADYLGSPGLLSYAWSGGAGTNQVANVSPTTTTTYVVTVTNSSGCTATDQMQVTVNALPNPSASNDGAITCINSTALLTATPAGLTYAWSGGGSGQTKITNQPGVHTVTVTDANGCTNTAQTTIIDDRTPPIADAGVDQEICIGESASLNASGGGTYEWSTGATNSGISVSPIVSTDYYVTVTAANGCTDIDTVSITVNPLPNPSINKDGDIQCDNASVQLTALPAGLSYSWSTLETSQIIDVTVSGRYTVTVTDANGCTNTSDIEVDEYLTPTTIFCERYRIREGGGWGSWTNFSGVCEIELCENDGLSDIQIDGGPDLNTGWVWRDEDNNIDGEVDETVTFNDIDLSDAGTYTGVYTNAYGCVSNISINVIVNANPIAAASNNGPITCSQPTVRMTVTPAGMNYLWSNGGTTQTNDITVPGTYDVTVTDVNGCTDVASTVVTIDTLSPPADAGLDVEICFGDTTTLVASGGVSYAWSNGAGNTASVDVNPTTTTTYTVTVTAANGCVSEDNVTVTVNALPVTSASNDGPITCSLPNVTLTALPAGMSYVWSGGGSGQTKIVSSTGIYTVTVTDSNGCTNTASTTVTDDLTPPVANAGVDDAICDGDNIDLIASGGVSFAWSNGAGNTATVNVSPTVTTTYTVTVTAANGCTDTDNVTITVNPLPNASASNDGPITCAQTNVTLMALPAGLSYAWSGGGSGQTKVVSSTGTYSVTVTDANGCTDIASTTVSIDTISPTANAGLDVDICFGDTTTLVASGGVSYAWSNTAGNTPSVDVNPSTTTTYTVTVTAANGCTDTDEVTVTVNPLPVTSASNNGPITCSLPNVTLTALPAGMSYAWSGGGSGQTKIVSTTGVYTVTVTDSNGCTNTASTTVTDDITPPTANAGLDDVICDGDNTDLTASGGVSYAWSNGAGNTATVNVSPSTTTTYTVTVTAANGCTDTDDVTVTVNPLPNASASNDGPLTCAQTIVTLTALPAGMSYAWSGGGSFQTKLVSTTGVYSVTVTDANGCTDVASTTVAIDTITPTADAGLDVEICFGDTTTLTASGGVSYIWSNSAGNTASVDVNPTTTTTYTVTVTAANGCTNEDNVTVTVNSLPVASASNDGPITCYQPNVTLTALPAGMSYAWSGGGSNQTNVVSSTGVYTVTVTDSNGCTNTATTTVTDDIGLPTADAGADDLICEGESIDLTASGGILYEWSHSAGNTAMVTVSPLTTTTYTVTVTGANGCQDTDDVTISVDPKPIVSVAGSDTICIQTTTNLSPSTGGTWQSSDNSIAVVSSSGLVYGVSPGRVAFTFTSSATGCPSDATDTITITQDLSVTVDFVGGICIEDDSKLFANVTGGTENFTYSWTGPYGFTATTDTIDVLNSGNYYVTVTDVAGCTDESSAYVYEAYDPFIFTLNTEVCEGEQIELSVNSSSAVAYQWGANAGNSTSQSVLVTPGVPSEDYYVTVTNNIGCTTEAMVHIDVIAKTPVSITGTDVICIGENTNLSPSTGGIWTSSNNSIAGVTNDGTVTGLSAGTVTFIFTDTVTNCQSDPTLPVTVLGRPPVNVSGPDILCEEETTTLSPSTGGSWVSLNPSVATVTNGGVVTAVSAGSASFRYTDSFTGCVSNATTAITVNPKYTTTITGPTEICVGENTYLSPTSGGTWSSSDTTIATISNIGVVRAIGGGVATFTFTSSYSCISDASAPVTVTPKSVITISGPTEVCEDESIQLSVSSVGGTWSSANNTIATINSSGLVTGVADGTVEITYTSDPLRCETDPTYMITVRGKPTVSLSGPSSLCVGEVSSVAASVPGGVWSSSDETVAIVSVDGTVVGLSDGVATFTYTDVNSCTSDASLPITVTPEVNVNIDFLGSVCLEDDTQIAADVTGGTPNFTYFWSGPGGFTATTDTIDVPLSGLYNVLVTDGEGCSSNSTAYVYEAYNPFVFTLDTEVCEGDDVTLSVNGSSGGTYQWSANAGSATTQSVTVTPPVPGDTYYVTITSPEGCETIADAIISVEALPIVNITGADSICVGATTTLSPSTGGLWSSSNYSIASVTNSGVVTALAAGGVTFTFRDTSTGCYSAPTTNVQVLPNDNIVISGDNDLCIGTPEVLTASVAGGTWSSSNTGVATVNSSGQVTPVSVGTADIIYSPVPNSCYNVATRSISVNNIPTVNVNGPSTICEGEITYLVPSNGGTWVSSDTTIATVSNIGIVSGVSGGSATFTFTSDAGCVQTLGTPITIIPQPVVSITGPSTICVNETTTLSPTTGGIWLSSNNNVATVNSSGLVLSKNAGVAQFTFIEFINGCVSTDLIEITVNPIPGISGLDDSNLCIGGTTNISPTTGGSWISNNPTVASITSDGTITALSAGAATFTFVDGTTGCESVASGALTVDGKPSINIVGPTDMCIGDVSSVLPSSGGTWSSSDVSVATIANDGSITAVAAGDVTFMFTSNTTGCTSDSSDVFTVSNPTTATITGNFNMCIGTNQTLNGSVSGTWSSSDPAIASVNSSGIVTANAPGVATITLVTTASCVTDPTFDVQVDPSPDPEFTGPTSICIGFTTTLSPTSGGTWESNDTTIATVDSAGNVLSLMSGVVDFTFTDDVTGCSATTSSTLNIFDKPVISLSGNSTICIGETTNMLPSSGGLWTSSDIGVATIDPNGLVTGISAGTVTFTFAETGTSCVSDASVPVTILPKPTVSVTGSSNLCIGELSAVAPTSGGSWFSSDESVATVTESGVVTAVSQGVARFTFVSNEGCLSNETSPIVVNGIPSVSIDGAASICLGESAQMLPSSGGTWSSSDTLVATIDNSGLVTSVAEGTASFTFTDSSTGCVSEESDFLTINGVPIIQINGSDSICIGGTTNFTPTTGGVWSSVNPSVATIENNGTVTAITTGTTQFIFTQLSTGCVSDTSEAIVVISESDPVFTGPMEVCLGDTTYISPTTGGTWVSTNTDVAIISNDGEIVTVGQGTAAFRFTNSATGCLSDFSESVTVNAPPTVFVDGDDIICVGTTTNLSPSTGGTWTSLNPGIATVDSNGLVVGVALGTAYFMFTDSTTGCQTDGSLSVEVQDVTPISITGADDEVCIGYTIQLNPTSGGIWMSNNEAIATISSSGLVTGRAPGKVTFTFTDISTGCVNESTSDSITVKSCFNHDFNVAIVNLEIFGNISTNDNFIGTPVYSNNPLLISKPNASIVDFVINPDGSYSFTGSKPGNYRYNIPICQDPIYSGCPSSLIEITLVENQYSTGNPVSNLDIATMFGTEGAGKGSSMNSVMSIKTNQNDVCVYTLGCGMDWNSMWYDYTGSNGLGEIKNDGFIEYTPDPGFIGFDTLYYGMCADGYSACNTTMQIITVNHITAENTVIAADDFTFTLRGSSISGNVLTNDTDAEGDSITVVPQGSLMAPIITSAGEYYIDALGDFNFTPNESFSGHTEIIYEICDDNVDQACMEATLHLLVFDDISVNLRVYLQGALMQNGGATGSTGRPLMRDDLRVSPFTGENYIPLLDPYTISADPFAGTPSRFNKIGPGLMAENQEITDSSGVFGVTGDNAIVDWVHVELRSKDNMAIPIATRSGLIQRDGDVVDVDGVSNLRFNAVNVDSFYVVVKHRSHLAAMSDLVSHTDLVDFTSPSYPVHNFGVVGETDFTGLSQNTTVLNGYAALWAGDFDANGRVKFTNPGDDQNVLFIDVLFSSPNFLINYDQAYGYLTGDFNMNSKTKYTNPSDDTNYLFSQILLYPLNSSFLSNYNSLVEQVPADE